jgi:hypothetical protein
MEDPESPADNEPTETVVDPAEGEVPKEEPDTTVNDTVVGPNGELYFYLGDEPTDDDDDR